jgi:hypothetical protein
MPVGVPVLGDGRDQVLAFERWSERPPDGARDRGELGQSRRGLPGGEVPSVGLVDGDGITPDRAPGKEAGGQSRWPSPPFVATGISPALS